ncbi:MAG: SEC-C domain-containing protein [Bryobacterales bacterium]|nr:SEC-C domain-containing protein [Bryobacterales bacterium]
MQSLTQRQLDVLQALSGGRSVTAAAEAAGVHRTTVHHWLRTIPEFRLCLDAARQAHIDAVRDGMNELAAPSLELLRRVIHDEAAPIALRMRTAFNILKFVATPEKKVVDKDIESQWKVIEAAFSQGHLAGRETAAQQEAPETQHNSSLSTQSQTVEPQTPRNALCPCGSGNKFKRCCGKDAPPVLGKAA